MFRRSPMAIGWIVFFLIAPAAYLILEKAKGTFNAPAHHGAHLMLLIWFVRALFELYGYLKSRRPGHGDASSA